MNILIKFHIMEMSLGVYVWKFLVNVTTHIIRFYRSSSVHLNILNTFLAVWSLVRDETGDSIIVLVLVVEVAVVRVVSSDSAGLRFEEEVGADAA